MRRGCWPRRTITQHPGSLCPDTEWDTHDTASQLPQNGVWVFGGGGVQRNLQAWSTGDDSGFELPYNDRDGAMLLVIRRREGEWVVQTLIAHRAFMVVRDKVIRDRNTRQANAKQSDLSFRLELVARPTDRTDLCVCIDDQKRHCAMLRLMFGPDLSFVC